MKMTAQQQEVVRKALTSYSHSLREWSTAHPDASTALQALELADEADEIVSVIVKDTHDSTPSPR